MSLMSLVAGVVMALAQGGSLLPPGGPGQGGVRLDAAPGMCEPADTWTFSAAVFTTGGAPASQARWPTPASATCLREVRNLRPGRYHVRVTPPAGFLPPYQLTFTIRAGEWTVVPLAFPAVVVQGRATRNGEPVRGLQVSFRSREAEPPAGATGGRAETFAGAVTDESGRYAAVLPTAGVYIPEYSLADDTTVPARADDVLTVVGFNTHNIELDGGLLRVTFSHLGARLPASARVNVTTQRLPQKPTTDRVADPADGYEKVLFSPGEYTVSVAATVDGPDGRPVYLVASRVHHVVVPAHSTAAIDVALVPPARTLLVVDENAQPVPGASVFPHPLGAALLTGDDGRVSLATVALGTTLTIRTQAWAMACHQLSADDEQRVVVPEASAALTFVFPQVGTFVTAGRVALADVRRQLGGAVVRGVRGSSCAIPLEAFSMAESRRPDGLQLSVQLPAGAYQLVLRDGRVMPVTVPGRVELPR